ncbi:MAG: DMT family transporter, partial [Treponema sp.]|nr:DMT family transporter [Treponema sp.]
MTERRKALAAIIACVLFWGFSFISIKITVAVFSPMSLGALRFALALVFLFFIKRALAPGEKLKLRDVPLLAAAGIVGVTLYFFCENNGVSLVTASEASVAIGIIPVLTMITDWLGSRLINLIKRKKGQIPARTVRINLIQWLGAIVSVAGVWLVAGVSFSAFPGNQEGGAARSPLGYVYMSGAAICWVAYCFLTRPLFARCSRIYIVFWQTVAGLIGFIPFAVFEFKQWGTPDVPVLLHLAFLGIGCSALGYWF